MPSMLWAIRFGRPFGSPPTPLYFFMSLLFTCSVCVMSFTVSHDLGYRVFQTQRVFTFLSLHSFSLIFFYILSRLNPFAIYSEPPIYPSPKDAVSSLYLPFSHLPFYYYRSYLPFLSPHSSLDSTKFSVSPLVPSQNLYHICCIPLLFLPSHNLPLHFLPTVHSLLQIRLLYLVSLSPITSLSSRPARRPHFPPLSYARLTYSSPSASAAYIASLPHHISPFRRALPCYLLWLASPSICYHPSCFPRLPPSSLPLLS